MDLLTLIIVVALLCTGCGIVLYFYTRSGFSKPMYWKLSRQEKIIVNGGVICLFLSILILWLGGYLT